MKQVKQSLLSAVAIAAMSCGAFAADLPAPVVPEPVLPAGDWTGFRVGLGGGYGGVNHTLGVSATPFGDVFTFSGIGGEGGLFTVEGGYDYQFNSNLVIGIQGDYTYSGIGTDLDVTLPGQIFNGFNGGYSLDAQHNFTVAGRIGWLADPDTLIYGLVGWTWTEFNGSFSGDAATLANDYDFDADGLTAGGGIEARFTPNISGKLEYRYTDYGRYTLFDTTVGPSAVALFDDISVQTIRAVVSYRFGNPGGYVTPTADLAPPAPMTWSGFRIGGGGGYGHVNHELSVVLNAPAPAPSGQLASLSGISGEGGFWTVEAGYDHQFSERMVAGIQFDYTGGGISTDINLNIPDIGGPTPINAGYELEASDSMTVAGRLGYLVTPDTLAYGLVGYTWTEFNGRLTGDAAGLLPDYSFDVDGLTAGAGIETRLTENLTGKLEYRYTGYDTKNVLNFPIDPRTSIDLDDDISVQTVRAVVSWKLPAFGH